VAICIEVLDVSDLRHATVIMRRSVDADCDVLGNPKVARLQSKKYLVTGGATEARGADSAVLLWGVRVVGKARSS
jgi:hypothetical protein